MLSGLHRFVVDARSRVEFSRKILACRSVITCIHRRMKAAQLLSGKRELEIVERSLPPVGPKQVKIRVKACGVCGSDVHLVLHGTMKCSAYPRIPGHEVSGIVQELGEGCERFQVGDRVVVAAGTSCGQCGPCLEGHENLCNQVGVFGFDRDGGYAEEMIVDERYLNRLPESIPFPVGAILADAVSTPYHAIRYRGDLRPGNTTAIFGTGGLGIHAVAVAKALGAGRIIALDIDDGALQNAEACGADELVNLRNAKNPGKTLKEVSGGVDVLLDFSGVARNVAESVRAMNRGGRMVLVGIGRSPLQFSMPFMLIERQITVSGSYGSDRRALPELIELVSSGRLDLSRSVTSVHRLEEANDCLHALEERRGNPIRFVLEP